MSALLPAKLVELDTQGDAVADFEVQFAPATLRLQTTNNTDTGRGRGRQASQANGTASTVLSLDLEFDTADEGTTDSPVDVRTLTNEVRKFVLPGAAASKQAPPKVQFHWGEFVFSGVMSQLSEEHDLFSPQGVPLRSKLSIQIKEQDPKFEALQTGTGANPDEGAPPAGRPRSDAQPGGDGAGSGSGGDRSTEAQEGETPAGLLSRLGLDPGAWRAVADALSVDPISFEFDPGAVIDFSPTLSLGAGIGVRAGVSVGLGLSVEARLGLATAPSGSSAAPATGRAQGFSLGAAGGFTAATASAATAAADEASARARSDFAVAGSTGATPPPTAGARATRAGGAPDQRDVDRRTSERPVVDRRSTTFGRGVPLRPRRRDLDAATPTTGSVWTVVGARQPPDGSAPGADNGDHRSGCGCRVCHPVTRRFGR